MFISYRYFFLREAREREREGLLKTIIVWPFVMPSPIVVFIFLFLFHLPNYISVVILEFSLNFCWLV